MTKEEIIEYYRKFENKWSDNNDSIKIVRFNNDLEIKVRKVIDSLEYIEVDTVLIYSVSYPGYIDLENIFFVNLIYPINVYIFWKRHDEHFEKKILNGCDSKINKTDSSNIVCFFMDNYEYIKDEVIIPVIYSAVLNPDSTLNYSGGIVSHEPKYSIYLKYGNDYSHKIFTENEIMNKDNLFYDYNLNLKTYRLFNLIDTKINEKNNDK